MQLGEQIPDLSVQAVEKGEVKSIRLRDYQGSWTVLFFYTKDDTGICASEVEMFSQKLGEFEKLEAKVIGASTNDEESHKAWFAKDFPNLPFPVIADPSNEVAKAFGVLNEAVGLAYRGTFVFNPEGVLKFVSVSDLPVGRNVEEVIRVIKALQTGELCQVNWTPEQATLGKG